MQPTLSGQASSDIAPEGIFHPVASRIFEGKGGNRGLNVSTCRQNGRILSMGGAYGKYSFTEV